MSVNFTKNQDDITKAWSHVVDSKDSSNWSLFGYEERSNNIKFLSSGTNGLKELVQEFSSSQVQYAFCRVVDNDAGLNKLVLINWQGESSDPSRKGIYASHVSDVANYFKGCSQTLTIRNDDEATPEYLMEQILRKSSSRIINLSKEIGNSTSNITPVANVGSSYKKIDIKTDISLDRSFWQRQEEEEKQRLEEEKKRAIEKQTQYERERKLREESEAKKLAETIKERDRIIEATRQAERRESSGSKSQPSSIMTQQGNAREDDSDERVGRRSELIRLERNQETQSLISKGLIKNKRAIFEQAAAQEHQQQKYKPATTHNMARRPSGTIVSQRLNTFKSLDGGSSASSSLASSSTGAVEKLANGISKNVSLSSGDSDVKQSSVVVKKAIETVKITHDEESLTCSATVQSKTGSDVVIAPDTAVAAPIDEAQQKLKPEEANEQQLSTNNGITADSNGTKNHMINDTHPPEQADLPSDSSTPRDSTATPTSNVGIRAKALYDYEAADSTEISFDPDDLIGYIEKVDSGWWHGSVITGRFKGLSGLFPSNYVEELSK